MEHGVTAFTWIALALVLLAGKLGGEVAIRLRQPAVLGELLAGIVLGNLPLGALTAEGKGEAIGFAAELGVMLLLFQVGLESSVSDMMKVGARAGVVAVVGVVVPSALGAVASQVFLPNESFAVHAFIGATLCATSVGITASVLKELGVLDRQESKIVLGAAVIDDVLGLIVLAVVSAVAARGAAPDAWTLVRITGTAVAFLVGSLALGAFVLRGVYRAAAAFRAPFVLGGVSIAFCLVLAGIAGYAGLAAIVGAYAAGLLLDEVSISAFGEHSMKRVEDFVSPIVAIFAPVFFVRTGMNVHLAGIGPEALGLAAVLVVVAVVGKLASGVGAGKGLDKLLVGLGMVPRGEVGLIFADSGARLLVNGKPVFSPAIYASLVAAVFVTTLLGPPLLAARIRSLARKV